MATRRRGSEGRQPRSGKKDHWTPTPMTLASLEKLEQRRSQNWRRLEPGSESFIHDNTSPHYSWLLPGWLAEERVVANGRVYRYYYDPAGNQYKTKYEVLDTWEKLGVIVVDP